jgi:hypothetical protein
MRPHRDARREQGALLVGRLVRQPGIDHGGDDAVDEHARARELLAHRLRERDHAGLRGRVRGHVRVALLAGDRGDVDDAPAGPLQHVRHARPRAVEDAVEVHLHDAPPLVGRVLDERRGRAGDAGVVHEHVDLPESGDDGLGHRLRRARVRDVELDGENVLTLGRGEICDGDAHSVLEEAVDDRGAEPAGATRDDRDTRPVHAHEIRIMILV